MSNFLEGEKVYLRQLEPCDSDYFRWFNNPIICQGNSHCIYPMTRSQVLEYIDSLDSRKDVLALAIIDKKVGNHIGNISLQNIHPVYRSAELAIILDNIAWAKGFATEAVKLIIAHGFNALNLHRISCATFRHNQGMRSLAIKAGFRIEGICKQAAWKDGNWVDVVEYGLLDKESTIVLK